MSAAASDDRHPADRCLRCGYSLAGLPALRACPECGLPEAGGMRVMHRTDEGAVARVTLLALLLGGCWLMFALDMTGRRGQGGLTLELMLSGLLVVLVPIAWYLRYHGLVAVNAAGLLIRRPLRRAEFLPWAELQISPARLRLFSTSGPRPRRVSLPVFFPMSSNIEDFLAKLVKERDELLEPRFSGVAAGVHAEAEGGGHE